MLWPRKLSMLERRHCRGEFWALMFYCRSKQDYAVYDLVKICSDFLHWRGNCCFTWCNYSLLSKSDGTRLPKRTRAEKPRATVKDIVKAILNLHKQLPQFYAVNLSRLPPVTPTMWHVTCHCCLAWQWSSQWSSSSPACWIRFNRGRGQNCCRTSRMMFNSCMVKYSNSQQCSVKSNNFVAKFSLLATYVLNLIQHKNRWNCWMVTSKNVKTDDQSLQSCIQQTQPENFQCCLKIMSLQTYSKLMSVIVLHPWLSWLPSAFSNTRKVKKPNKLVVGKSRLQSVATKRTVDLFISRLDPNTADGELVV